MAISITIDDLDPAVLRRLHNEAQRRGVAVNVLVKDLLKRGLLQTDEPKRGPNHDLDALAGTWSDPEAEAFLAAIADLERVEVLAITRRTAEHCAAIFLALKTAGTPIPTNDLWIAASALEHGLGLFSYDDKQPIWRYMDYAAFVAMLQNKALHFATCDRFVDRDPFEGSLPGMVARQRRKRLVEIMRLQTTRSLSLDEAEKEVGEACLRDKQFVGANWWYMKDHESDAMWRLYAVGGSVAVRSTVGRLKKAITDPIHRVHIGRIHYIDYGRDSFEERSIFS